MADLIVIMFYLLVLGAVLIIVSPIIASTVGTLYVSTVAKADDIAEQFALATTAGTVSIESFDLSPDEFAIQLKFSDACNPFMGELRDNGIILRGSQMDADCLDSVCFCIGRFNNVGCELVDVCSANPNGGYNNEVPCDGRTCYLNWSEPYPSWLPIGGLMNISNKVIYTSTGSPTSTLESMCTAFFSGAFNHRTNITLINCGRVGTDAYITIDDGMCSGGCDSNLFLWVRPNTDLGISGATGVGNAIKTQFEVIK
jgi:hypothetical protein